MLRSSPQFGLCPFAISDIGKVRDPAEHLPLGVADRRGPHAHIQLRAILALAAQFRFENILGVFGRAHGLRRRQETSR